MSTKPTRQQVKGGELLARALLLIAEAARLDGRTPLDGPAWSELASRVARASTAIGPDEILALALEARGGALGLASGTAELLTLVGGDVPPVACLLLDDDAFKAVVARAAAELGEI